MKNKSRYITANNPVTILQGTLDNKIIKYQADRNLLLQGFELNYISNNAPFNITTDNPILHCWQQITIDGSQLYERNSQPVDVGSTITQYYPFPLATIFVDTVLGVQRTFSNQYHFVASGIALIYKGEKIEVFISNAMTNASIMMSYTLFLQEVFPSELDDPNFRKNWGI